VRTLWHSEQGTYRRGVGNLHGWWQVMKIKVEIKRNELVVRIPKGLLIESFKCAGGELPRRAVQDFYKEVAADFESDSWTEGFFIEALDGGDLYDYSLDKEE
jgi:hypothetical protein